MKRAVWIGALVLSISNTASGQVPPELLARGRTILVEDASVDGAPKDAVSTALQKWNRFEVVTDKARADLILTIRVANLASELALPASSREPGTPQRAYTLEVTDPVRGQRVWTGSRDVGFSASRTMRRLVEQFRKYVERSEAPRSK